MNRESIKMMPANAVKERERGNEHGVGEQVSRRV